LNFEKIENSILLIYVEKGYNYGELKRAIEARLRI
jgi:hypothetical protein